MRILLKFRGFIYQFEMFRSGGLAVLNALARPGDYQYQEHRFNGIPKSVVSATNYFLDKVYTEGPVLTIFTPFTDDDHWDLFGPENHYPMSQPVNFVRGDAPELYLLHGADDTRVRRGHSKSLMEKQVEAGGFARREVYEGMGHADAVVSFSRIHRRKSPLVRDIQTFISSAIQPDQFH